MVEAASEHFSNRSVYFCIDELLDRRSKTVQRTTIPNTTICSVSYWRAGRGLCSIRRSPDIAWAVVDTITLSWLGVSASAQTSYSVCKARREAGKDTAGSIALVVSGGIPSQMVVPRGLRPGCGQPI